MTIIDKMVNWAIEIANSGYGYSQDGNLRWGGSDSKGKLYYDCSAFCLTALNKIAGIEFSTGNQNAEITFTGNMYRLRNVKGLLYLPYKRGSLQRGDIIYYHKDGNIGHVAMYIGNNKMAEARGTKYGVVVSTFRESGWQYIIRIADNKSITEQKKEVIPEMDLQSFPSLKQGDKNIYVSFAQVILKRYVDKTLEVDGSYGTLTANAVQKFYENCGYAGARTITNSFWKLAEQSLVLWDGLKK